MLSLMTRPGESKALIKSSLFRKMGFPLCWASSMHICGFMMGFIVETPGRIQSCMGGWHGSYPIPS